jgi:hypothetical protein
MNDSSDPPLPATPEDDPMAAVGRLWPSPEYNRQIERLRAAVGETVYLAEIEATQVQVGVRLTDRPYILLGLIDFPRPDPVKGLAPHLVLLDDGRGVNLGRIARISTGRAFGPAPADILFQDRATLQALLFHERQLSKALIARRSKQLLGEILGKPRGADGARLPGAQSRIAPPDES